MEYLGHAYSKQMICCLPDIQTSLASCVFGGAPSLSPRLFPAGSAPTPRAVLVRQPWTPEAPTLATRPRCSRLSCPLHPVCFPSSGRNSPGPPAAEQAKPGGRGGLPCPPAPGLAGRVGTRACVRACVCSENEECTLNFIKGLFGIC